VLNRAAELREAIRLADLDKMVKLIKKDSATVEYNAQRHVIQLASDCNIRTSIEQIRVSIEFGSELERALGYY